MAQISKFRLSDNVSANASGIVAGQLNLKVKFNTMKNNMSTESKPMDGGALLHEAPGKSYWTDNECGDTCSTLWMDKYIMGKSWLHDKTERRQYGWVKREDWYKEKPQGKFIAEIPGYDEDTGDEIFEVGKFDTINEAKASVIQNNHPHYSVWSV